MAHKPDEVDVLKEEIAKELTSALGNIRLVERGVYVQASTLGALEALLDFLKSSKIPVSFIYMIHVIYLLLIQYKFAYFIIYYSALLTLITKLEKFECNFLKNWKFLTR